HRGRRQLSPARSPARALRHPGDATLEAAGRDAELSRPRLHRAPPRFHLGPRARQCERQGDAAEDGAAGYDKGSGHDVEPRKGDQYLFPSDEPERDPPLARSLSGSTRQSRSEDGLPEIARAEKQMVTLNRVSLR